MILSFPIKTPQNGKLLYKILILCCIITASTHMQQPAQNGIIKLACGNVSVHKGPLINTGLYFKADHFGHGFSFTTAYSFASQQKNRLTPQDSTTFDRNIINSDATLAGWNMHTFNFVL